MSEDTFPISHQEYTEHQFVFLSACVDAKT